MKQKTDDVLIHEFMGRYFRATREDFSSMHQTRLTARFKSFERCQKLCDRQNKFMGKGQKYVVLPDHNICYHYKNSWEWLMPVVEKIEGLGYWVRISYLQCTVGVVNQHNPFIVKSATTKKLAIYKAIVELIEKHESNK